MLLSTDKLRSSFFKESIDAFHLVFEAQRKAVEFIFIFQAAFQICLHAVIDSVFWPV